MTGEITKAGGSPAYVQAIPSDSLGSATVKMIGGKSVVNAGEIISAKVDKVVTKDSGDVQISEYPIPAAVQALPGYGWSAGDVYNYVDLGRKKFVKMVDSYTFRGNEAWTKFGTYDTWYTGSLSNVAKFAQNVYVVSADFSGKVSGGGSAYSENGDCWLQSSESYKRLHIYNKTVTSLSDMRNYTAGKTIYFPLATPIETDISEYITDDVFLDTEVGGAVTFHQQDDTSLEVPNIVEHTVGRWKQISGTFGSLMNSRRVTMFRSAIDTSPRIMAVDKSWTSSGTEKDFVGSVLTEFYSFQPNLDAVKETQYWDEANQYLTSDHVLFLLKYYTPSTGVSFGSYGKHIVLSNDEQFQITYWSPTRTAETAWGQKRQKPNYCMAEYYPLKVSFNLTAEAKEDSYAYWAEANSTRLMPIGVRNGDVIFAGKNTPYYGKLNIYD